MLSAGDIRATVAETSLQRLREVGELRAEPIVTLSEFLALLAGRRTGVMLELKVAGIIAKVRSLLQQAEFANAIIYSSFRHDELMRVRELVPAAQTLALVEAAPIDRSRFAIDAGATHAGIHFELADITFVTALRESGVKVFVYTVNERADIQRMIELQVDGIISDYPDRVLTCTALGRGE
jgi:glycerophosphoryl diester phosphodiesterase